MSFSMKWIG